MAGIKKVIIKRIVTLGLALICTLSFFAFTDIETKAQKIDGKSFTQYVPNGYTGFALDSKNTWYYFYNGRIAWGWYGLAQGPDGNWYFSNGGYIDWNVTGLAYHNGGWFYVDHGKVNWKANTLCKNDYGWWKVTNGVVDFKFTGFYLYNGAWYYLRNGYIDWGYYGLAQGPDGNWYFSNGGYIDWYVTGTAYYNGRPWKVVNGKVAGAARFLNETGYRYLKDYFGKTRKQFVDFMINRETRNNFNYYLNTPFVGLGSWSNAHNLFYCNGSRRSDGFAGMNCGSFVAVATRDAGCNLAAVYPYSELKGNYAYTGLAKASAWYKFAVANGIKCRAYASKWDLLADGWAQRGDLVYCRPDYEHGGYGDIHIGIYWGGYAGEDSFWHSLVGLGNKIGPLQSAAPCIWYVYKWE